MPNLLFEEHFFISTDASNEYPTTHSGLMQQWQLPSVYVYRIQLVN